MRVKFKCSDVSIWFQKENLYKINKNLKNNTLFISVIQNCFICRSSDSPVSRGSWDRTKDCCDFDVLTAGLELIHFISFCMHYDIFCRKSTPRYQRCGRNCLRYPFVQPLEKPFGTSKLIPTVYFFPNCLFKGSASPIKVQLIDSRSPTVTPCINNVWNRRFSVTTTRAESTTLRINDGESFLYKKFRGRPNNKFELFSLKQRLPSHYWH